MAFWIGGGDEGVGKLSDVQVDAERRLLKDSRSAKGPLSVDDQRSPERVSPVHPVQLQRH